MDKLLGKIQEAITVAQEQPKGREGALVVIKLREAEHWHRAALGLWNAPPEPPAAEPITSEDVLSDDPVDSPRKKKSPSPTPTPTPTLTER